MYLRRSTQKRADGTKIVHLQLAESYWDKKDKKRKTQIVYNFGRADDEQVVERLKRLAHSILKGCSPEELEAENADLAVIDAWNYGDIFVLEQVWERLGIRRVIEQRTALRNFGFSIERAVFAMIANRVIAPSSKLYCWEQWLREDVRIDGTRDLELHHLYRAMDVLEADKEAIEQAVYFELCSLLNLDVEVVFYDTTSLHFEVDDNDYGHGDEDLVHGSKAAGAKTYAAPRKRGHAKNGRSDAPQVVVGLAVTRDGFPVRHWVFPGNTVDVKTVHRVKQDLKGWRLGRCVFVGDAGMVSKDNLKTLAASGGKYIVCMPMGREKEVSDNVLSRAGRYKEVAENLRVKDVVIGEGERRRRYVVCHNPLEERRQKRHREKVLHELQTELDTMAELDGEQHTKRICRLRTSRRYGKYLRMTKTGEFRVDKTKIKDAARNDGKFVVHSNDDTLSAEDMALGYKQLQRVEEAWRDLKSVLRMRPVYHWVAHRIHAHIFLTVLALLVQRYIERACEDTWRNIRDDLKQIKLVLLSGPNGKVLQTTEPRQNARKRLKSLKIKNPPVIVDLT